jgi:hypothetical protein
MDGLTNILQNFSAILIPGIPGIKAEEMNLGILTMPNSISD